MPKSIDQLATAASERAAAAPAASKSNAVEWPVLFGPVEEPGGRADCYVTAQPSTGVEHIERRPRGHGRVKRVPLVAVLALGFRPPAAPRAKRAAASK